MIIAKLQGGLGNQLFQYAIGRSLACRNNDIVKLNVFLYGKNREKNDTPRQYALGHFQIDAAIAEDKDMAYFMKDGWRSVVERIKPYYMKSVIKERQFNFDSRLLDISRPVYLQGYWQSWKYFKDYEDVIRREVTLKEDVLARFSDVRDLMKRGVSVSVHVRRGDYVANKKTNQVHGVCTPDYYKEALHNIESQVKNPVFFVFSDDIEWVKRNIQFPSGETNFVSARKDIKDYEELMLMSKCKHNIIANSSFSWWGAWLNQDPGKIVIAPKRWFADSQFNTKDLLPESWMKV